MAEDHIRYDILAQDALRGVVRKVLAEVAKAGLPGEHHFYISFLTRHAGVRMPERLLAKYDREMTILLQHQFWDLKVSESGFEVGLSFDGLAETLAIPFSALKSFYDPSVQFAMQFDSERTFERAPAPMRAVPSEDKTKAVAGPAPLPPLAEGDPEDGAAPEPGGEKVVSLDAFRKKP